MIKRLCIFGVGLIGGSLALALKKARYCDTIIGCDLEETQLQRAAALGVIDEYSVNPKEAVKGADIVILAVPVRALGPILYSIVEELSTSAVITDTGSSKGSVINTVKEVYNGNMPPNFVAGHPIAGSEKSSVEASIDDLFYQHKVILTPTEETNYEALNTISAMWRATGANVEILDVEHHDALFAMTSHLPQLLAFSLINTLSKSVYSDSIFDYVAGGFTSFSRIASSDPMVWRDICLNNKNAILDSLEAYEQGFLDLKNAIRNENADEIHLTFENAKNTRDRNIVD